MKVGNKDIAHSVRQNSSNPNLWEVVFHPVNVAPHRITLSFNGVPKPGVLEVPVRAPGTEPWAGGLGLYQARVSKVTAFTIDTLGRPAREFDVVVSIFIRNLSMVALTVNMFFFLIQFVIKYLCGIGQQSYWFCSASTLLPNQNR